MCLHFQHIIMAGQFRSEAINKITKFLNRRYFKNQAAKNTDIDDVLMPFEVQSIGESQPSTLCSLLYLLQMVFRSMDHDSTK